MSATQVSINLEKYHIYPKPFIFKLVHQQYIKKRFLPQVKHLVKNQSTPILKIVF